MPARPSPLLLAAVALLGLVASPARAQPAGDVCADFEAPTVAGTVADLALVEISGVAGSRAHPGVLWTHNDSGGQAELFAMAEDGAALGAYAVEGAGATDWEDLAVGPGPEAGRSYLYAADIGDNAADRSTVTVYRVAEPDAAPSGAGGTLTGVAAIGLRYPDGPSDAEALLVDPLSGDLLVVTKSYAGRSHVLRAAGGALADGATVAMTDEATIQIPPRAGGTGLPGTAVTGGDISPDGSIVLLRTYQSVLAFGRDDGQTVAEALTATPCSAPQVDEPQGEAVAFTGAGDAYVTMSEGANPPVHRVGLVVPAATTTSSSSTTIAVPATDGAGSDDLPVVAVVVVVVLVAATAGVVVRVARRRRRPAG